MLSLLNLLNLLTNSLQLVLGKFKIFKSKISIHYNALVFIFNKISISGCSKLTYSK